MTIDEFTAAVQRADLGPLRADLLAALVLQAEGEAKRLAPVRTGTLRRSISGRVLAPGERGAVGSNVTYAAFVERGTVHQAAQPYLQPGIDKARAKLPDLWATLATRFWQKLL